MQVLTPKLRAARMTILLPTLLLLLSACQLTSSTQIESKPSQDFLAESWPDEIGVGKKEHPRILESFGGVYEAPFVERKLSKILGQLIAATERPDRSYRLTILDSPQVNAFALPGGYLYVTRGLLALTNQESEIAAVLAHEIAHITARHAAERIDRATAAGTTRKIVNLVERENSVRRVLRISRNDYAQFTQRQELQADKIGIETLAKADFDPHAASSLIRALSAYSKFSTGLDDKKAAAVFTSHPATPARLRAAVRLARRYGPSGAGSQDTKDYIRIFDKLLFGPGAKDGYVRGRSFFHPELKFSFNVPRGFELENRDDSVVASNNKGLAIRFDAVDVPNGLALQDYLRSGWVKGLDLASVRSTTHHGIQQATAHANVNDWIFHIAALRHGGKTYRFIAAASKDQGEAASAFAATLASFRSLGANDIAKLKPLVLRVYRVKAGETVASIASRMRSNGDREKLFRILNGLRPKDRLRADQLVKIVSY